MLRQQQMAVIVEVANDRNVDLGHDGRDSARCVIGIDRHPDQLAARLVQRAHLRRRRVHVGGIGVGHRLDDDRVGAAHLHAGYVHYDGLSALMLGHASNIRKKTSSRDVTRNRQAKASREPVRCCATPLCYASA